MAAELQEVPKKIKEQFGSEGTSALIARITDALNLGSPRPITKALYLLETKGVPAHDFIQSMTHGTGITDDEAGSITKELKEKVLEPIRDALFQWGIDISDINVNKATNIKWPTDESEVKTKTISLEDIGDTSKEEAIPVEAAPITAVTLKPLGQKPDSPFILHEEDVPEGNVTQRSVFKSVTSPLGGFFLKKRPPEETKSPFAKLQIPGLRPKEKRIVHYSETRTPLSQLEEPSFINVGETKPLADEPKPIFTEIQTDSLTGAAEKPAVTIKPRVEDVPDRVFAAPNVPTAVPSLTVRKSETSPAPAILGAITRPEPKVEGNVIDLKGE